MRFMWKPIPGFESLYEISDSGEVRRTMGRGVLHRRLSGEEAAELVRLYASGIPQTALARKYGLSQPAVSVIIRRGGYCDPPPKIRKQHPNSSGYMQVILCKDGVMSQYMTHRLVAAAFIGPCPPDHQVNHKNGKSADNRASNLEYMTGTENARHSLYVLGNGKKLTPEKAGQIRKLIGHKTTKEIAAQFGVSIQAVYDIKQGRAWNRHG